jgi:hypothetical protein
MSNLWDRYPVAILTVLGNLIALLVAFGVDVTSGQKAAAMALAASLLAVVAHTQVTPVAAPNLPPEVD